MSCASDAADPAGVPSSPSESVRRGNRHSEGPYKNGKEYQATTRGSSRVAVSDGCVRPEHMFELHRVRTTTEDGETWFVAADVSAILEHTNPTMAMERLEERKRAITMEATHGRPHA